MERILTLAVGVVMCFGGGWVIKTAWDEGSKNSFHAMLFALGSVLLGLFLVYVAIFGPPDIATP